MTIRVGAGAIVVRDRKLLVVHLHSPGKLDLWIPPGGGMEPGEGAFACAERECFEETGLRVRAQRVVYVDEILDPVHHHIKFWVLCEAEDGEPHTGNCVPDEKNELAAACFLSREELAGRKIASSLLRESFWSDFDAGFPDCKYLGVTDKRL